MTEIRRLVQDELIQLQKMHAVVYNQRRTFTKEDEQSINQMGNPPIWSIGVFQGAKLLAGMGEIDFLIRFDGHSVKMTGIGGVGTLPEARMGGHIRKIFEKILPEAYEKGVIFSNLAPFSHDFYRKFGYEIACERNNISIPTSELMDIKPSGEYIHILPGDDTSMLAQVHSAYIKDLNHAIHKDYWPDNRAWKIFTKDDPYSTGCYVYLWKDENGVPSSYIKYQDVCDEDGHNMSVTDLAFVSKKGLFGILGLVGGLSAQFNNFKWQMPTFLDPCDFCGNAWEIEMNIKPRDMTRVVNVKTALELMRRPSCEIQYVIEVDDSNISANEGKYLVETGPQGVKVTSTTKNADIICDIHTLSQLVTGYRSLENALFSRREGLEVNSKTELLKQVFTWRPGHITEYF